VGETSSDFRDTLLEVIETSQEPVDHPSPDQWLAYQRGELSAEEEARLQEHLVRCRDCFDLAAGAADFAQPETDADTGESMEAEALWRLVRSQLDPPPPKVQSIQQRPPRRFRRSTLLAASFFVALVGMTLWNLQQQSELATLRTPRNVPTLEITAGERIVAGGELSMPAGPRVLRFHPAEDLPFYQLVIRDAATGRELSSHKLVPDQDLTFNLYLPERLPGRYRLELLDGAGKLRETHILRITGD
jgi:Putative zinc-finger